MTNYIKDNSNTMFERYFICVCHFPVYNMCMNTMCLPNTMSPRSEYQIYYCFSQLWAPGEGTHLLCRKASDFDHQATSQAPKCPEWEMSLINSCIQELGGAAWRHYGVLRHESCRGKYVFVGIEIWESIDLTHFQITLSASCQKMGLALRSSGCRLDDPCTQSL